MIKVVNGIEIEMTGEEASQRQTEEVAAIAKQAKQDILDQIIMLEAQITERRLREVLISGDKSFITDINNQITVLRTQL